MHAAPICLCSQRSSYVAAARRLLGLRHTNAHTSAKGALSIAIKAFLLACHPHFSSVTNNRYDEFMASM